MFIQKNKDGTINLTAPVLIPGAKDCDYQHGEIPFTKEQIQTFAKSYERYQFIDHEHGLTRNGQKIGVPVKSFLLTEDQSFTTIDGSKTYPSGTWMMTSHLTDEMAIKNAMDGKYTGYSVSVFSRNRADQYLEALKTDKDTPLPMACKTINSGGTALIKDITDPVVLSVSLVKSPCLHDSKFCELNDGEIMEEDVKSLKSKVLSAMGMSEEAEVEALKAEVESLEAKIDEMKQEFNDALKTLQGEFERILTDALTPVKEEDEAEVKEEAAAEKSEEAVEEEPTEEPVEEEVEEATEEEEAAEKSEEVIVEHGESKAEPVHDNIQAEKSKPFNIYSYMGRNRNGTAKRKR